MILVILYLLNLNSINCFYKLTIPCDKYKNCKLPNCNCESDTIPSNLTAKYRLDQLPQLVVLTIGKEFIPKR